MNDRDTPTPIYTTSDLLGLVPYLLGFHPQDSVVTLLLGPASRLRTVLRHDLSTPVHAVITDLRKTIANLDLSGMAIVGYGPASTRGALSAIIDALDADLPVTGRYLVDGDRYWCLRHGCFCPAADDGAKFDAKATAAAARATVRGLVALPCRGDLLALTEPDPQAQQRIVAALDRQPATGDEPSVAQLMAAAEQGIRLDDEQTAALAAALRHSHAREQAWRATGDQMWQRDLWLDVLRRVPDDYVAGPAALAAWCAWRRGEGTLAVAASRRVAHLAEGSTLAELVVQLVRRHIDPRTVPWPPLSAGSFADLLDRW